MGRRLDTDHPEARSRHLFMSLLLSLMLVVLLLAAWIACLHYQQFQTQTTISQLRRDIDTIHLLLATAETSSHMTSSDNHARVRRNVDEKMRRRRERKKHRPRRSEEEDIEDTEDKPDRRKKDRNRGSAIHLAADVNNYRINRQLAEGLVPIEGNLTTAGLVPHDHIYRMWKESHWSDSRVFSYDRLTGKVTVKKTGTYLLYGQVLFHDSAARKAYGIHINDVHDPYVQALAFDSREDRIKRSLVTSATDGSDSEIFQINAQSDTEPEIRHSRSRRDMSKYSQCNTMAVAHLTKGDELFVRSLERHRTIIPQPSLTFWGLARL